MSYLAVQSLLKKINKKSPGFEFESIWNDITSFYDCSTRETKIELIKELEKLPILPFINSIIAKEEGKIKAAISAELLQLILERYKQRVLSVVPNLGDIALDQRIWQEAKKLTEKRGIERYNSVTLIQIFSEVLNIDFYDLDQALLKENLKRPAKPIFNSFHKQSRVRRYRKDDQVNNLRFAGNYEFFSPLKRTGISHIIPLPTPSTSGLLCSPGGTSLQEIVSGINGKIFKPSTPRKRGRKLFDTPDEHNKIVQNKYPRYSYKRPDPIEFTVTRTTIENRKNIKRRVSQRQLTGAPCIEVFKAEGYDESEYLSICGNRFHWSHMIAYFLGGKHSEENLLATSSAANLNILHTVEKPIAARFFAEKEEERIKKMHIVATPIFNENNNSTIPDALNFKLTWKSSQNKNVSITQEITINTRSEILFTNRMQQSISVFRKLDEQMVVNTATENTSPPVNKNPVSLDTFLEDHLQKSSAALRKLNDQKIPNETAGKAPQSLANHSAYTKFHSDTPFADKPVSMPLEDNLEDNKETEFNITRNTDPYSPLPDLSELDEEMRDILGYCF